MQLGKIIRDYRQKNKLTMNDFAKLSGISKPYVSMLEANKNSRDGKNINPSIKTLQKISGAINIPMNDLLRMLEGKQLINSITEDEIKLLANYRELNALNKQQISNMISAFLTQQAMM